MLKKYIFSKWLKVLVVTALGLASFAGASQAALTAVDPGPYTAATGFFPLWYSDSAGTTLDLCLSKAQSSRVPGAPGAPTYMCTLLPLAGVFDDTLPTVFPFNWPDEAFWFTGDATITDTATGIDLTYVSALEAAFGGGNPAPGDQISFARIRIRVDVPVAGTYIVTHPYGVETFNVTTPGIRAINMTRDIGIGAPGVFTGALAGDVGPFLRSLNGPYPETNPDTGLTDTFIGDPNLLEPVTGSPFGTNFVRIQGPGIDLQTDLFAVSGRIWNNALPTNLSVDRSTYKRQTDSVGNVTTVIDVFASSTPTAAVNFRETLAAGNEFTMTPDGAGNFYAQDPAPATLPPFVVVTANDPSAATPTTPTPLASAVVDVVKISHAIYAKDTQSVIVVATSSDEVVAPTLTAVGFGTLDAALVPQRLVVSPVAEPPATITVKSSAGGEDTEPVVVLPSFTAPVVTAPAPITVAAPTCATSVPATDPAIVAFLAAATATDSQGNVLAVTNDAPAVFLLGTTTVTFSATDSQGAFGSATSTVTVTGGNTAPVVNAPAPITITVPQGTTSVPATDPQIAAFLAAATATDAEDGTLTVTNDAPADFPLGATTVTFSATDSCGVTTTATSTVTVGTNTPPVVTAPAPITVTAPLCATSVPASDPAIAAFLAGATAIDAQDGNLPVTNDAPASFPLGTTTVTFTATDSLGATGSATSTVTVNATPNTAPVVTPPAPITLAVPPGTTAVPNTDPVIVAFLNGATATDAQDGALPVVFSAPASFPLGTTTVTFSATDSCGLTTTATSTVTVTVAVVNLNIQQFKTTNNVRVARNQAVTISLSVRNAGTVNLPVPATVVGEQNGVQIYTQTLQVSDPVGGGATSFTFPAFTPTVAGNITWTVTVNDATPSTATDTTRVR